MATGIKPSNLGVAIKPSAVAQAYFKTASVPLNYQVELSVAGDKSIDESGAGIFPMVANLPERFHMEFSSQWSSPFSTSMLGEGKLAVAAQAAGIGTKLKMQSVKVWDSTSALAFSIDLIFVARTNTVQDIRNKHMALLKLTAPSETTGGVLLAPGPTLLGKVFDPNSRRISMRIGNYMFLDNVIITSVGSDINTLSDAAGIPIQMSINIGIETLFACYTAQDIEASFIKL